MCSILFVFTVLCRQFWIWIKLNKVVQMYLLLFCIDSQKEHNKRKNWKWNFSSNRCKLVRCFVFFLMWIFLLRLHFWSFFVGQTKRMAAMFKGIHSLVCEVQATASPSASASWWCVAEGKRSEPRETEHGSILLFWSCFHCFAMNACWIYVCLRIYRSV